MNGNCNCWPGADVIRCLTTRVLSGLKHYTLLHGCWPGSGSQSTAHVLLASRSIEPTGGRTIPVSGREHDSTPSEQTPHEPVRRLGPPKCVEIPALWCATWLKSSIVLPDSRACALHSSHPTLGPALMLPAMFRPVKMLARGSVNSAHNREESLTHSNPPHRQGCTGSHEPGT